MRHFGTLSGQPTNCPGKAAANRCANSTAEATGGTKAIYASDEVAESIANCVVVAFIVGAWVQREHPQPLPSCPDSTPHSPGIPGPFSGPSIRAQAATRKPGLGACCHLKIDNCIVHAWPAHLGIWRHKQSQALLTLKPCARREDRINLNFASSSRLRPWMQF